jgi:hypothetical protein
MDLLSTEQKETAHATVLELVLRRASTISQLRTLLSHLSSLHLLLRTLTLTRR